MIRNFLFLLGIVGAGLFFAGCASKHSRASLPYIFKANTVVRMDSDTQGIVCFGRKKDIEVGSLLAIKRLDYVAPSGNSAPEATDGNGVSLGSSQSLITITGKIRIINLLNNHFAHFEVVSGHVEKGDFLDKPPGGRLSRFFSGQWRF